MKLRTLYIFATLQILDVATTLYGFSIGAGEASPFVRFLIGSGPISGLVLSKVVAVGLLLICLRTGRSHVVGWINYWYSAVAIWNFYIIFAQHGLNQTAHYWK